MHVDVIDLQFQGRSGAIASFLVEGPSGKILIETGPESTRSTLLAELADRGVAPADLSAIFVTHIHLDHAGAAGWFAEEGIPVFVHPKGARHLVDPTRLVESARQVYGKAFDALWGEMTPAPVGNIREITDRETVEMAGLSVTAISTPGHAFHHHAYVVGDAVFAGDAAGARIDDSGYLSVTSAPPQFHLGYTLESIAALAALEKKSLYLTHFGAVPDPKEHLADYRDAVELNVEFVRLRLEEKMDPDSLAIAYQAFQMEQAFRCEMPSDSWETLQMINGTEMCADGIRLFWERESNEET